MADGDGDSGYKPLPAQQIPSAMRQYGEQPAPGDDLFRACGGEDDSASGGDTD